VWSPFTSPPLVSGGGSSTSDAGAKHMLLAACVGGVIGRSARPLFGLTHPYRGRTGRRDAMWPVRTREHHLNTHTSPGGSGFRVSRFSEAQGVCVIDR